jgi:hypothetical protein
VTADVDAQVEGRLELFSATGKTDLDILKQARNILLDHGWTQGRALDCTTGQVCAIGAVIVALGAEVVREPGGTYLLRFPYSLPESPDEAEWAAYFKADLAFEKEVTRVEDKILDALQQVVGERPGCIPDWNDLDATTVDDVIQVFDLAIENEESK